MKFRFGERDGAVFWTFGDGFESGSFGDDSCFLVLASTVLLEGVGGESFHSEDLDVVAISSRKSVIEPEKTSEREGVRACFGGRERARRREGEGKERGHSLVGLELVHLLDVNSETSSCVELPGTVSTLEVLGFLMLHQN